MILPREHLIEAIWSVNGDFIDDNALTVAVKRLRQKIGATAIKTVYGLGYMWEGIKNDNDHFYRAYNYCISCLPYPIAIFIGNWFLLASYAIFMLLSSITYILHQKHKNIKLIRKLNDLFDKTYYKPDYTDHELSALEQKLYNLIQSNKTITEQIQNEKERMNSLISDIAHQVKTPLSNIIMYADLLLEDKSSDNDKPMKIHMQAEKLRFLIDALIKMSRCENGLITGNLNIDHYNIKELLTRAVSDILPVARKKNITIYTNCDSKLTAFFDMKWTSEAIYNILDNAVKYSNANGTINIKVTPYEFFVS